jgi:rare lipoprotein A
MYKVGTPYQIGGVWYYPAVDYNYDETGVASWYGEDFDQQYTANGEIFDLNQLTAAHRTLPMPSIVQVTNLDNGRSMQLRVNDRGPFARGRIVDVSRRAAQLLGFETNGAALVRVSILKNESIRVAELAKRNGGDTRGLVAEAPSVAAVEAVASTRQARQTAAPPPPPAPVSAVTSRPVVEALPALREKVDLVPIKSSGRIFVQAGGVLGPGKWAASPVAYCAAGKRASNGRLDTWRRTLAGAARAAAERRAGRSTARTNCRQRLSRGANRGRLNSEK